MEHTRHRRRWPWRLLWLLAVVPVVAGAGVSARDHSGRLVTLDAPARRIVTLAPHLTELVFAAGAGAFLVGTVEHSDYPPPARRLPRVGGAGGLDLEALVALRPDLVAVWPPGLPPGQEARLESLGVALFRSEPRDFEDIARDLEALGRLAGTPAPARAAAEKLRARVAALRRQHAGRRPLRVFYQLWDRPLMTVGGGQFISRVLELCGAENVFADLAAPAPVVEREAVLAARPEVILAAAAPERWAGWRARWRRWPALPAVRNGHLYRVAPDLLQRPGPRLVDGAEAVCRRLARVRRGGAAAKTAARSTDMKKDSVGAGPAPDHPARPGQIDGGGPSPWHRFSRK